MTHRILAVLMIFAGACMTGPDDAGPRTAGKPQANLDLAAVQQVVSQAEASSCVEDGCPAGQACDWILGCTDDVTFCCADQQCGKNRFCDFDAGGICTDRP